MNTHAKEVNELEYGTTMFQNLMTHKVYTVFFEAMAKKSFDKFSLQCVVIPGVGSGKYV